MLEIFSKNQFSSNQTQPTRLNLGYMTQYHYQHILQNLSKYINLLTNHLKLKTQKGPKVHVATQVSFLTNIYVFSDLAHDPQWLII